MIQITLRFATGGVDLLHHAPEDFVRAASSAFPNGWTLIPGRGYWWDAQTNRADHEDSWSLIATGPWDAPQARIHAAELSAYIRHAFTQTAVWVELANIEAELLTDAVELLQPARAAAGDVAWAAAWAAAGNADEAPIVTERSAFRVLYNSDVDADMFPLRRRAEGSGNPYSPESLLTGREIRAGLGYDCPRVGPLATWKDAIEGKLTPQQVEQRLPRVAHAQAREHAL